MKKIMALMLALATSLTALSLEAQQPSQDCSTRSVCVYYVDKKTGDTNVVKFRIKNRVRKKKAIKGAFGSEHTSKTFVETLLNQGIHTLSPFE